MFASILVALALTSAPHAVPARTCTPVAPATSCSVGGFGHGFGHGFGGGLLGRGLLGGVLSGGLLNEQTLVEPTSLSSSLVVLNGVEYENVGGQLIPVGDSVGGINSVGGFGGTTVTVVR